jgi:hypothetical protein
MRTTRGRGRCQGSRCHHRRRRHHILATSSSSGFPAHGVPIGLDIAPIGGPWRARIVDHHVGDVVPTSTAMHMGMVAVRRRGLSHPHGRWTPKIAGITNTAVVIVHNWRHIGRRLHGRHHWLLLFLGVGLRLPLLRRWGWHHHLLRRCLLWHRRSLC